MLMSHWVLQNWFKERKILSHWSDLMLTCFSDALNKMEQASEVIIRYISLLWKETTSILPLKAICRFRNFILNLKFFNYIYICTFNSVNVDGPWCLNILFSMDRNCRQLRTMTSVMSLKFRMRLCPKAPTPASTCLLRMTLISRNPPVTTPWRWPGRAESTSCLPQTMAWGSRSALRKLSICPTCQRHKKRQLQVNQWFRCHTQNKQL